MTSTSPAPPLIERIAPGLGTLVGLGHAGFGSCGLGSKVFGIWGDAHPSQVQAIRVPAGQHGWVGLRHAIAVVGAGLGKPVIALK